MECKFDTDLIQEYVEGTIEPLEKIFVVEHLKVCRKCRKELNQFKLLYYELENLEEIKEVPEELENVRNAVMDNIFDAPSKYTVKDFVKQHKNSMVLATEFVEYLPGKSIVEKGIKATGLIIGTATKKGAKYGLKLIQART